MAKNIRVVKPGLRDLTQDDLNSFWKLASEEVKNFAKSRFSQLTLDHLNEEKNWEHRQYILTQLANLNKKTTLNPYSDDDLENYVPEPQTWLIENQIPKGEIGLLVGKRGEKKTWTAFRQVYGLAAGIPTFGDNVPEPKKVLVIDEETGKNQVAIRRRLIKNGLEINQALQIKFLSFEGLKLDRLDSEKFIAFKNLINDFRPDLIIVDCLARVVSFEVDKDNASINELFTSVIRPFINEYGMTWLFLHHLRKSPQGNVRVDDYLDEIRGGTELVNYCRFVLMCQTPKYQTRTDDGSEMMVFSVLKMSNTERPEPKVISFCPDKPNGEATLIKMDYLGRCEDVLATEVRVGNAILEYLFANQLIGEIKTKDIEGAAEQIGFKRSFLSIGLKSLVERGKMAKIKRGVYELTESAIKQNKVSEKPPISEEPELDIEVLHI
jgi:hypothetical protein